MLYITGLFSYPKDGKRRVKDMKDVKTVNKVVIDFL